MQREKYHGDRSTKVLVKYAMQQLRVRVVELWDGNYRTEVEEDESGLPWVITFCGDGGGGLLYIVYDDSCWKTLLKKQMN